MNTLLKLLSILLFMNICIYIGIHFSLAQDSSSQLNPDMSFRWKGDLIDKMLGNGLDDITISTKSNWTDYDITLNESFTSMPTKKGGAELGQGGISFLDSIDMVFAFFKTLWNVAFSPIIFFLNFRVPVFFGLLLGIPMTILYITTIVLAIRGVGD